MVEYKSEPKKTLKRHVLDILNNSSFPYEHYWYKTEYNTVDELWYSMPRKLGLNQDYLVGRIHYYGENNGKLLMYDDYRADILTRHKVEFILDCKTYGH